jgi:hypothetical protein
MRITDLGNDPFIAEQIPTNIGAPAPMSATGQSGSPPQQLGQSNPQTLQQNNPAMAAQAAKDQQDRKKQIQDQIRATEQQLANLRKQLAQVS